MALSISPGSRPPSPGGPGPCRASHRHYLSHLFNRLSPGIDTPPLILFTSDLGKAPEWLLGRASFDWGFPSSLCSIQAKHPGRGRHTGHTVSHVVGTEVLRGGVRRSPPPGPGRAHLPRASGLPPAAAGRPPTGAVCHTQAPAAGLLAVPPVVSPLSCPGASREQTGPRRLEVKGGVPEVWGSGFLGSLGAGQHQEKSRQETAHPFPGQSLKEDPKGVGQGPLGRRVGPWGAE